MIVEVDVDFTSLRKEVKVRAARLLNEAAREIQKRALAKIKDQYQSNTEWFRPDRPLGLKIKEATPDRLEAKIFSDSEFLGKAETGGVLKPRKQFFAIPRRERLGIPKRGRIPKNKQPGGLKDAFRLQTAKGPVLAARIENEVRIVYELEPQVEVKRRPVFEEYDDLAEKLANEFLTEMKKAVESGLA